MIMITIIITTTTTTGRSFGSQRGVAMAHIRALYESLGVNLLNAIAMKLHTNQRVSTCKLVY